MGRKKYNPGYDPGKIQKEMIEICRSLCVGDSSGVRLSPQISFRSTAAELDISVSKVIKLLITGGYYTSDICERINALYDSGMTIPEIQEELSVSRATVQSYLPYRKGIYNAKEISMNAERIRVYRERTRCVERFLSDLSEDNLWNTVVAFQRYPFYTVSGLLFRYEINRGKSGSLNKELLVSRRKESKTLAWSSIRLAFNSALQHRGEVIERPKALGDIRGVSYIYPMLYRFGIIEVPEKAAEKMGMKSVIMVSST